MSDASILCIICLLMKQVCHRDLKLENTLLDGDPALHLKICDFGYSKVRAYLFMKIFVVWVLCFTYFTAIGVPWLSSFYLINNVFFFTNVIAPLWIVTTDNYSGSLKTSISPNYFLHPTVVLYFSYESLYFCH